MIRHITATRRIDATPATIYSLIADYHDGHRRIVPPKTFRWLAVDRGGIGAGTEIRFGMRVLGSMRTARGVVSEPLPGRVLVETYPETGDITTFTVEPAHEAGASSVTITTDFHVDDGFPGRLQGFMAERVLRPLYLEELKRLADLAEGRVRHEPVPQQPQA
jgi:hypothetical protein